jgi:hypothetical protein
MAWHFKAHPVIEDYSDIRQYSNDLFELERRLLDSSKFSADRQCPFWSFASLSRILTKESLSKALTTILRPHYRRETSFEAFVADIVQQINPIYEHPEDTKKSTIHRRPPKGQKFFLRTAGILLMISRLPDIVHFIELDIHDGKLPLQPPWTSTRPEGEGGAERVHTERAFAGLLGRQSHGIASWSYNGNSPRHASSLSN